MTTAYIAGPMSNIEGYNYAAFHAAEEQLRDEGYEVNNPARNFGGNTSLPYTTYIEQAIRDVLASDWIFCLPGWRQSVGARTEVHVAATLGSPVYEATGLNGKRRVRVDKFGTPSTLLEEAVVAIQRGMDRLKPLQLFPDGVLYAPPPREVTDYQGAVDGGGQKRSMYDPTKLPLHLIPPALLTATAEVLGYGAQKYAPGNWMRGMSWTVVYASLQRHLLAWFSGEDIDSESGLSHMAHASCCVAFLLHFIAMEQHHTYDDRAFKAKVNV